MADSASADFRRWRENVRGFVRAQVGAQGVLPALTAWVSAGNGPRIRAAIDLTAIGSSDNTDVQRHVLEAISEYDSHYAAIGARLVTAGQLEAALANVGNRHRSRQAVLSALRAGSRDFGMALLSPTYREDWQVRMDGRSLAAWEPGDFAGIGMDFIVAALESRGL